MSKIALTGNASGTGTLTIAAPNTDSDRTINIPDSAGDLVLTSTTGDLTLDVTGDIILDADGADIRLKDNGTQFAKLHRDSGDFKISSSENDKDILFMGADGGSDIEAARFDMSEGGCFIVGSTIRSGTPIDVRKDNPSSGRMIAIGSNGTPYTALISGLNNAVCIARSRVAVASNTTTNLVSGYGGSMCLITLTNDGGNDAQYTFLVTHAWSSASVLFTNTYGQTQSTFTFSAASGVLRLNHNHNAPCNVNVACLISAGPSTG